MLRTAVKLLVSVFSWTPAVLFFGSTYVTQFWKRMVGSNCPCIVYSLPYSLEIWYNILSRRCWCQVSFFFCWNWCLGFWLIKLASSNNPFFKYSTHVKTHIHAHISLPLPIGTSNNLCHEILHKITRGTPLITKTIVSFKENRKIRRHLLGPKL